MRILVVEDEKHIASFIKQGLQEAGYAVDTVNDGEKGYFLAGTEKYDLIVLDIMLPKMDGITVCKNLRKDKVITPILMLTAKHVTDDKVTGLDAGADDYLTKPFALRFRPVLITNLAAMAGFLPMALNLGHGAEVLQPFSIAM